MSKENKQTVGLYLFTLCIILVMATSCAERKSLVKTDTKTSSTLRAEIKSDSIGRSTIKTSSVDSVKSLTDSIWYSEVTVINYDTTGLKKKSEVIYKHGGGVTKSVDIAHKGLSEVVSDSHVKTDAVKDSTGVTHTSTTNKSETSFKLVSDIKWIIFGLIAIAGIYLAWKYRVFNWISSRFKTL